MTVGVRELEAHPRFPLVDGPSPLHRLPRLGDRLGIDLWVKRDDALPLAMGGNKVRQLEYYVGRARAARADTLLITGAVQSNFVRLTAAAGRLAAMRVVAQLEERVASVDPAYRQSGNVLLTKLLGAEIRRFPVGDDERAADANLEAIAAELASAGRRPFVIHLGVDHPPIGALGYVRGAIETIGQCRTQGCAPDLVVAPSGSGLTHAGFLVGALALGWRAPVLGACVRRDAKKQKARILERARSLQALMGAAPSLGEAEVTVDDAALAPGYGKANAAVLEAIDWAAQDEALLLDPVYSGRTLACLIAARRAGRIADGATVLFLHTGGAPAIFAYADMLARPH